MSPSVDRARSLGSPDNDARSRYRKSKAELPTHRRLAVAAPGEVHDVVREGAVGDGGRAASGGDVEGFGLNLDEEATVLECFPEPWLHQLQSGAVPRTEIAFFKMCSPRGALGVAAMRA